MAELWTIRRVLTWTTGYFQRRGLEQPRLEAEVLLAGALATERVRLYIDFDRPLEPEELTRYRELVRRRAAGEPTAYLIGEKEFMALSLVVTPEVLIPRPETEQLVEVALDFIRRRRTGGRPCRLLADIGTGSGAIAVAVACACPELRVLAVDISPGALAVAARNRARHQLQERIELVRGDLLQPLLDAGEVLEPDLVTANLPYIPSREIPALAMEVRQEPVVALDGGGDGLDLYRRLIPQAKRILAGGGGLLLEIGWNQGAAVRRLFSERDWQAVEVLPDFNGHDRVVLALRREEAGA